MDSAGSLALSLLLHEFSWAKYAYLPAGIYVCPLIELFVCYHHCQDSVEFQLLSAAVSCEW